MGSLNQANESKGVPLWAALWLMLFPSLVFVILWFGR